MTEGIDQLKQIEEIQARALADLDKVQDEAHLDAWRVACR